ncbi:MAG: AcrR family transcriptional regulator [Gammaproteobacteria bacterium]|jgi:AcrR family transcriptional regulator
MPKTKKTRTRLSPDVRKNMILDHAAEFIATDGVSALSMERLGKEAGISKSLVYAYFPSMNELLQTLLKREYKLLRLDQTVAADSAETFEQFVRRITRSYLAYIEKRGLLLERLMAEPSVAALGDPTTYRRSVAVDHVAKIVSDNFNIDIEIAKPVIDISFGLPAAAGNYLISNHANRQTIEDITVAMMIGSIEAIRQKYETSLKPLIRN